MSQQEEPQAPPRLEQAIPIGFVRHPQNQIRQAPWEPFHGAAIDSFSENASAKGFSRYTVSPSALFRDVVPSPIASPTVRRPNRLVELQEFEGRIHDLPFDRRAGTLPQDCRLVDMFLPYRLQPDSFPANFPPPVINQTSMRIALPVEEEPARSSRSNSLSHCDGNSEENSATDKKRLAKGLKLLSVTVRDIVNEQKSTTYKEVADIILKDTINMENMANLPKSSMAKEEQNVKRRVYDALNVLISAGVLIKDGKKVRKNDNSQKLQINLKRTEINTLSSKIVSSSEKTAVEVRGEATVP